MTVRSFLSSNSLRTLLTIPQTPSTTPRQWMASIALDKNWNFDAAKADFLRRSDALKQISNKMAASKSKVEEKVDASRSKMDVSRSTNEADSARYATLVPLCIVNETPCVLFTLRSANLLKHRGEISFPGGKCDPMDENLVETSLRETEEEIGFPRSRIEIWTSLPAFPTRNKEGFLTAVVGFCGVVEEKDFRANPNEVEQIFVCSLAHLCDEKNNGFTTFRSRFSMPFFRTGKDLDWRNIWGMTAVTLEFVLQCLVPQAYPHRRLAPSPSILKTKPPKISNREISLRKY